MKKPRTGVVILAAGKGTRMAHDLPKVLVPVGGVPMILRALAAVERASFGTKPVVVVGDRKNLVIKTEGSRARFAVQRRMLGTGHAVMVAVPLLKGKVDEVLVVYGDNPLSSSQTLRNLVRLRHRTRATMSLITVTVPNFIGPRRVFLHYGHIVRDRNGQFLERCIEYKDATRRERAIHEVNSGFYCFEAKWLWSNLGKLQPNNVKGEYYLTDLLGLAVLQGRKVAPYALKNWRQGIGANCLADVRIADQLAKSKR